MLNCGAVVLHLCQLIPFSLISKSKPPTQSNETLAISRIPRLRRDKLVLKQGVERLQCSEGKLHPTQRH